jgi:hypothetical protein
MRAACSRAAVLLVLFAGPSPCAAQEPPEIAAIARRPEALQTSQQIAADSFERLRSKVGVGDKVIVTDVRGHETRGRIADLSATSLALTVNEDRVELSEADIERVSRRDSRWSGTLWGAATGLVLGAGFERALAKEYGRDDVGTGTVAMPFTVIGAGIGYAVDALIKGERVLYSRAHTPTSGTTISAVLGGGRKGVAVSVSF